MKKFRINVDTCVVIALVANLKKPMAMSFGGLNQYQKLLYLADRGLVEFYVTPQIWKEMTHPHFYNPNKKDSSLNYFIKHYLKVRPFDLKEIQLLQKLVKELGTTKCADGRTAFSLAEKVGDRNFADCTIWGESNIAEIPLVTDNLKDYKNYKVAKPILKRLNIPYFSMVYSVDEAVNAILHQVAQQKNQTKSKNARLNTYSQNNRNSIQQCL